MLGELKQKAEALLQEFEGKVSADKQLFIDGAKLIIKDINTGVMREEADIINDLTAKLDAISIGLKGTVTNIETKVTENVVEETNLEYEETIAKLKAAKGNKNNTPKK